MHRFAEQYVQCDMDNPEGYTLILLFKLIVFFFSIYFEMMFLHTFTI